MPGKKIWLKYVLQWYETEKKTIQDENEETIAASANLKNKSTISLKKPAAASQTNSENTSSTSNKPLQSSRLFAKSLTSNLMISIIMVISMLMLPIQATDVLIDVNQVNQDVLPKPNYTDYPKVARWALARANFGTLATISTRNVGFPFGNVASVSDGIHSDIDGKNSTGSPYFYLTLRDVSAQDIAANARVSFQITQATFPGENYCHSVTAEDPTCVRLTLSGNVRES